MKDDLVTSHYAMLLSTNEVRKERSLSPIPEERGKSKRRVMRLVEESFSSSRDEDVVFAIAVEPINLADITTIIATSPTSRATRPAQRGIVIRKLAPQEESV